MKILIVTQYFWPENFPINGLARGLQKKGYQVAVFTGKPNYPGGTLFPGYRLFGREREDYHGIDVKRVPLVPRGKGGTLRLALNYLSFVFFASILAPFKCSGEFDLIFVYEPSPVTVALPALLMKKLKGWPIMFWVQDLWPESLSATRAIRSIWFLKMVERLVRFIYRGCDRILVQSRAFVPAIEKFAVPGKRILYFPNSAEELYQPVAVEEGAPERSCMPRGFRIMFAGNIGAAQDFSTILKAAERLKAYPDLHWVILGDGRMFSWVKEQVKKRALGGTVHLLGRHPVETMPRYFSLADVMLVTLKRDPIFSMTIPAKLQSYMACGKPLIAALDGQGARVVGEAGAGLAPPAENPEALAEAVLEIYRMSDAERRDLGLRGRRYFEANFDLSMLVDRLDGWIKDLKKEVSLWES